MSLDATAAARRLAPPPRSVLPTWGELARAASFGSGPLVARTFHRVLGVLFAIAFGSLAAQLDVLIGQHGLAPAAPLVEGLATRAGASFLDFPSVFRWLGAGDDVLRGGAFAGVGLGALAALGLAPRACFLVATLLYASFLPITGPFLAFQWDNLLVECGLLAVFLPRRRAARWIHVLFLVLLFKLYFESGLAKWQSHLRDWHDGSAMTHYYETAPIPAWLAWHAHNLPRAWHLAESRLALELELVAPLLVFGPRVLRLSALVAFTGFQAIDLATANYGFFCYLALALHLFLLDDADLARAWNVVRRVVLRRREPWATASAPPLVPWRRAAAFVVALGVSSLYVGVSLQKGLGQFARAATWAAGSEALLDAWRALPWAPGRWDGEHELRAARRLTDSLRAVNNYHLFGHITRERPEPELEVRGDADWTPLVMHHKAGPLDRAGPYVAPHQPRVDFLLWFYGLDHERGAPGWVRALVDRLCHRPHAVQPLFVTPLPTAPAEVRIRFWRYRFTTPAERAAAGHYWTREALAATAPRRCR